MRGIYNDDIPLYHCPLGGPTTASHRVSPKYTNILASFLLNMQKCFLDELNINCLISLSLSAVSQLLKSSIR